ncbi:hypothetical protein DICPUDRAFT_148200 [Dictyostelium purpureum]|uniref:ORM1-like protein 3 n=1 Tax=Dictyostelium purpureum TaxID=5786 RepID=F0ZAI5_DICPU|nr:uncharacterized protein DICPUDRAFT_148200 [Dictyostelium purpureum]EGC39079.1 hypothetical protein DICPUDRAFT_148200 [Dictyostelium purpureum]|eukprot:XP_003284429.1 hypothetical protein DICPUDRAFT_148200 [Dictyostelium purpureum]
MTDEFQINRNQSWMHSKRFWVIYIVAIIACKVLFSVLVPTYEYDWLTITLLHAVITFFGFHWQKGIPFFQAGWSQGKYSRLTLWEQIDRGQQYTPTRKFFTIIPIILFMITLHSNGYKGIPFYINAIASFVIVLSKMPRMDRVRLFGINKY